MKQVLHNLRDGNVSVTDIPAVQAGRGELLIRTSVTLVSPGTERMLVRFGKGNWFERVRQQPDKVRKVLDKVRTDGVAAAIESVLSKLNEPVGLGYCNVGAVAGVGAGVGGFAIGDRIVSNGRHAELVCVPRNLCARVPDGVTDEQAAFVVLAAVGLQGIRLANPTLGENVVVSGLGLIGLLTVQMLRAQGCRVLGLDFDPARLALARRFGAETFDLDGGADPAAAAAAFSRGRGVDAVIIAASTDSSEPVSQAAKMCRPRGRIVLVGVTGLELSRTDFYEKELTFQVSCSYGPGRYDSAYEEGGHDYPVGYVRWTEQRNFEAVLDLMAAGSIDVAPLITHRFALDRAAEAYELLVSETPSLGILLDFGHASLTHGSQPYIRTVQLSPKNTGQPIRVAFLGAGNHASRVLMPAFRKAGAGLHAVVSRDGVSAESQGRRHGFVLASTDATAAMADPAVQAVVVATRHDAHASQVLAALQAGRHVFCEKPLCLTLEELEQIAGESRQRSGQLLMVGFNRRFAPHVTRMRELLAPLGQPRVMVMTVNAGAVAQDHWTQDSAIGGGRILGEGCHFIDLLRHLADSPIVGWNATSVGWHPAMTARSENATITLQFADGSLGIVHYLANGSRAFPKERLDVFCASRVLQLDNFRTLRGWGWPGFRRMRLWRQDKGHAACVKAFVDALRMGAAAPIPVDEVFEVSRISIEAQQALR